MEEQNKDRGNWLDGRQEVLPDGFWEMVEPHIPVYQKKRRIPIIFWFGMALALVGILIYTSNNNNYKKDIIESKNNVGQITTATTISGIDTTSNLSSLINEGTSINGNYSPNIESKQHVSTQNSDQVLYSKTKLLKKPNKTIQKHNSYQTSNVNNINKSEDENYNGDVQGYHDNANKISIQNDQIVQEKQAFVQNLDINLLPLLNFGIVKKNIDVMINQKISTIKSLQDRRYFTTDFGYNMILLDRSMTSKSAENLTLENRQKYERDYVSHELFGDLMYRIHPKWSIGGGLRYTRVQELFDYDYQIIEGNALKLIIKKRTLEHTNTMDLIDLYGQVDYHFKLSNVRFTISNAIAYNTALNVKGLFLNETNTLDKLENALFYKTNVGWSNQFSLGIHLPISDRISLGIRGGYRHYFNDWSNPDTNTEMRYHGFTVGSSVGYRF